MNIIECSISGPLIIEPKVYGDDRGFFLESWNALLFQQAGLDYNFVQDNHSRSNRGVLRGLHFQNPCPQGGRGRHCAWLLFKHLFGAQAGHAHHRQRRRLAQPHAHQPQDAQGR